jgi:outer membrane protein TolC
MNLDQGKGTVVSSRKTRCPGTGGSPPPAILLCAALCVVLPGALAAQERAPREPVRISPDEAVSLTIQNNLNLQKAGIGVDTLRRKSDLSWNQFIPGITLGGSLSVDNEKSTTTVSGIAPIPYSSDFGPAAMKPQFELDTPEGTAYNWFLPYSTTVDMPQWHIAGQMQISLTISAAMFEAMKTLRLDYEGGQLGYENAKLQMERDVRKMYNQLLLAQEQAAVLRENYDAADRQVAIARANYNAGLAPELNVLQAQVSRENLRPQIEQAESGIKVLMARFADIMGFPYDTPLELVPVKTDDNFVSLDVTEMIQKASSDKPEIQALRQEILGLESRRKAAKLQLTPALTLSWTGSQAFTQDPWKDSWFDSGNWRGGGQFSLSLGWKLDSLFPFSSGFQAIKDVEAGIQSKNIDMALAVRATEIEISENVLNLERIRLTAETHQQAIDLAERTTTLTEQAYRAGLQDFLQVQNAVLALRQARVQMLQHQFDYLNGLINLEYSIGVPFGTLSAKGSN